MNSTVSDSSFSQEVFIPILTRQPPPIPARPARYAMCTTPSTSTTPLTSATPTTPTTSPVKKTYTPPNPYPLLVPTHDLSNPLFQPPSQRRQALHISESIKRLKINDVVRTPLSGEKMQAMRELASEFRLAPWRGVVDEGRGRCLTMEGDAVRIACRRGRKSSLGDAARGRKEEHQGGTKKSSRSRNQSESRGGTPRRWGREEGKRRNDSKSPQRRGRDQLRWFEQRHTQQYIQGRKRPDLASLREYHNGEVAREYFDLAFGRELPFDAFTVAVESTGELAAIEQEADSGLPAYDPWDVKGGASSSAPGGFDLTRLVINDHVYDRDVDGEGLRERVNPDQGTMLSGPGVLGPRIANDNGGLEYLDLVVEMSGGLGIVADVNMDEGNVK